MQIAEFRHPNIRGKKLICIFTLLMNFQQKDTSEIKIYLAPLQGFTDFVYRKSYNMTFPGVDAYFIPYISTQNNTVAQKYKREILAEYNKQDRVIPQILAKDAKELLFLSELLSNEGYSEMNLNLGCPYPMVTNRGRGAGLLSHPEKLDKMLSTFFKNTSLRLSVKMRTGLNSPEEIESVVPVLNKFPLTEVIFHPRIAKQLYSKQINHEAFRFAANELKHPLVYNGDIFTCNDFIEIQNKFPGIQKVMIGRGILMNPFLPAEIKGIGFTNAERREKLILFHQLVLDEYTKIMDNEGNVLNKMKQFWSYFIFQFPDSKKQFKQLKKARSIAAYNGISKGILESGN